MRHNGVRFTIVIFTVLLITGFLNSVGVSAKAIDGTGYSLTIYVDEGFGERNGHVFIGLTAGQTTTYAGWYSENKNLDALWGGDGGDIKNDAPLASCGWDVKKKFDITKDGYQKAINAIVDWANSGKAWAVNNHCGDFGETIAQIAGVPIKLPSRISGRTRPELFGEYLRGINGLVPVKTFELNSALSTGLRVNQGDKVSIEAEGTVKFGKTAKFGSPEGVFFGTFFNFFDNIRHGALIARVHRPGAAPLDDWFYVGNKAESFAKYNGILELAVNDNFPWDNEGSFEVRVRVCGGE